MHVDEHRIMNYTSKSKQMTKVKQHKILTDENSPIYGMHMGIYYCAPRQMLPYAYIAPLLHNVCAVLTNIVIVTITLHEEVVPAPVKWNVDIQTIPIYVLGFCDELHCFNSFL